MLARDDPMGTALADVRSVVVVVPDGTAGYSLSRLEEELRVAPHVERRVR